MLKRIYIDNFKCLVNFELQSGEINLFLGSNGSGKTTVFQVLQQLQKFILNENKVSELFKSTYLTRWQNSLIQTFELDIEGNGGTYKYSLKIEHTERGISRMFSENLTLDNQTLFSFSLEKDENGISGNARLYNDNPQHKGVGYSSFDWSRSGVGFVQERHDNKKLTWFKKRIENFFIVRINPLAMDAESRQEDKHPNWDLSNYSAWYSYLSQADQGKIIKLTMELQKILEGFDSFKNLPVGEARILSASFPQLSKEPYKLNELSDGQRVLIALYTLIYCTPDENYTLCIDEPENFLALPEIQPWLRSLFEQCQDKQAQAFVISHHPVLINYLASSSGYWFSRKDNKIVRLQRITDTEEAGGLSIAKLIELGWIYDE